ncbi:MAG: ATP-binding protein [Fidelibacterota bacterium]
MIDIFKQLIVSNQERIQSVELIERDIPIDLNASYVIVGPRRAGKTYFLYQLIQKTFGNEQSQRVLYINFEDERLLEITSKDLVLILDAYKELFDNKPVIYFDEIQNVDNWQTYCRRLVDEGYQVYVTGSNTNMLSQEIAATLGGRFFIKEIFPLSFVEYLMFHGIVINSHSQYSSNAPLIKRYFNDYLKYGGFPELIKYTDKRDYLNNLFKKVFYGDILVRYNLKNKKALELLVKKLAESVEDETSFNRMKNLLQSIGIKVSTNTIIDYLTYLKESYLVIPIQNIINKFSDREMKKKYYFIDVGLLNLFLLEDFGKLLENLVFNELNRNNRETLMYYKRRTETDFFLPEQERLIQVSFDISNTETRAREIKSLLTSMKDLKVEKGLILTQHAAKEEFNHDNKKITIMPTWQWLLENNNW